LSPNKANPIKTQTKFHQKKQRQRIPISNTALTYMTTNTQQFPASNFPRFNLRRSAPEARTFSFDGRLYFSHRPVEKDN